MKKRIAFLLLALLFVISPAARAAADHYEGREGWSVEYTPEFELVSNFRTADYNDPVLGLQPGDDITFTVHLANNSGEAADWYMTNEVLHSLEDRTASAAGGAYTYVLRFEDSDGENRLLYSSDTVGGDFVGQAGEGLHEATDALKDYFFLSQILPGQTAIVTLNVSLDGETQGNGYQRTLGDLQMNFAVQREVKENKPQILDSVPELVKTGDESHIVTYFIVLAVSGLLLLVLAIIMLRWQRRERKRGEK